MNSILPLTIVFMILSTGCKSNSGSVALSQQLHDAIDAVVQTQPDAVVAVSIIDPSTSTEYHRNGDRLFHAASMMKVPVLIELYCQTDLGRIGLDDSLDVHNRFRSIVDGSEYAIEDDSDDDVYEKLGRRMSIRDLAYQMITVSSNLATNLLIQFLSADSVQTTSERLGTTNMITLRGVEDLKAYERGQSNRATSRDLAVLMEAIRTETAVSPAADRDMLGILLKQRFNEMIPEGLPERVLVAHKTGQITEINHDAAIVIPETGESYVLVILTEGLAEPDDSAELGADLARAVHGVLRPE